MLLLADESCDGRVARALRDAGHDVQMASIDLRGESDHHIMEAAAVEGRVVITEDLDFGKLVFVEGRATAGIILVRWPADDREGIARRLVDVVAGLGAQLVGAYTVVRSTGVRIRRLDRS